jgi:hypothetical protein
MNNNSIFELQNCVENSSHTSAVVSKTALSLSIYQIVTIFQIKISLKKMGEYPADRNKNHL